MKTLDFFLAVIAMMIISCGSLGVTNVALPQDEDPYATIRAATSLSSCADAIREATATVISRGGDKEHPNHVRDAINANGLLRTATSKITSNFMDTRDLFPRTCDDAVSFEARIVDLENFARASLRPDIVALIEQHHRRVSEIIDLKREFQLCAEK
ncbi:MAG TPA: hypothetical protein P5077_02150 [bacterium]|nr:hypothetical protein [bacterium]